MRIDPSHSGTLASAIPKSGRGQLLDSRYPELASNTIDYWMLPDDTAMTRERIENAMEQSPVLEDASLQIYVHVPFCAQRCRFCAFSGGNDLNFKQAERYSRLVMNQVDDLINRIPIKGHPIRSINIGGGSPDLVGTHIGYMLKRLRGLPGCHDDTEISVEFTLSTASREFIDLLADYEVTKASFGIQSLNPEVRKHMRQPKTLKHLEQILTWIDGRIPVVNADLITGLPGQTLQVVQSDLRQLMEDPRVNAISSYLLTPGAAPSMLAAINQEVIPPSPAFSDQAMMRLQTYGTFLRNGWTRRGTNTYVDPSSMSERHLNMIAGNECIGTSHYQAFLIGAGPQAISCFPGARVENHVNIKTWAEAIDDGGNPYHLPKCSDNHQKDTALWVFPLRWEGLPQKHVDWMRANGALSDRQERLLKEFEQEGLIVRNERGYELSILGEVFMGCLVRDLKGELGRAAVDQYIEEGKALGRAISAGVVPDENMANNRQLAETLIQGKGFD